MSMTTGKPRAPRRPRTTSRHTPVQAAAPAPKSTKIRIRWDRIAGASAVGILFAAMIWWGATIASEPVPVCTDKIADAGGICKGEPLPPCPTEDSTNCYWDADVRGNGTGRDFIDIDGSRTFGNQ